MESGAKVIHGKPHGNGIVSLVGYRFALIAPDTGPWLIVY